MGVVHVTGMSGTHPGIVLQAAAAEESSEEESSEEDESDEEMAEPAKPASNKRKAAEVHSPSQHPPVLSYSLRSPFCSDLVLQSRQQNFRTPCLVPLSESREGSLPLYHNISQLSLSWNHRMMDSEPEVARTRRTRRHSMLHQVQSLHAVGASISER